MALGLAAVVAEWGGTWGLICKRGHTPFTRVNWLSQGAKWPQEGEASLGFYSWDPMALEGQQGHMPYAVSSAQWGRKQESSFGK